MAELNCREASRLLSLSLERELSPAEEESLARHLSLCRACRNFKVQVKFLRSAARRYGPQGSGAD